MTSSLHKKRRITRRSILRWMQDSVRLSVGLSCVWGVFSPCDAGESAIPRTRAASDVSRVAVDGPAAKGIKTPTRVAKKPIRTASRIVRAQSEFEESPATSEPNEVVPPPSPPADALQRLRSRSAKARWDELHQEWLRARKNREVPVTPAEQQPPAAEEPVDPSSEADSPFDSGAGAETRTDSDGSLPSVGNDPAVGTGVRKPTAIPGRVYLQSQQKTRQPFTTDTEDQIKAKIQQQLDAEVGPKMAAPIKDPAALPKITEIDPNPLEWAEPAGRPVPEQDAKRYIKLGDAPYIQRAFPDFTYTFEATNVYSNPLYFEDPTLERYGHTRGPLVQPIVSVARFGAQIAFLPYQMAMKPPCAKIYPLGWYGPGEYVPYRMFQPPLNAKAAAVQAGTILGVSYGTP